MARMITSGWLRESYQQDRTDWRAAAWSGVIAGAVFLAVEMLMVMAFMGESPWAPPRMMAAMLLGRDVLPPPADFDAGIVMAAMLVHFPLSIVYGLITGWIVHRLNSTNVLLIGAVFGMAIYFINFYLIAPAAFPWFMEARNGISVTGHLIYGLVLGASYAALRRHKSATQR